MEELIKRKEELFQPIYQQILMTDDRNDILLLGLNMAQSSIEIFLRAYGEESTRTLLDDMIRKRLTKVS